MDKNDKIFDEVTKSIIKEIKKRKLRKEYVLFKLKFNPFPPAGTPRFPQLPPLDKQSKDKIINFIRSTYFATGEKEYAGLTIIGEYGMGKTHLMKYIQIIIDSLSEHTVREEKEARFSAITCFIDRPEDSPQMVIHRIIEQIGLDNIRKYLGKILIDEFKKYGNSFFDKFRSRQSLLIAQRKYWKRLFDEPAVSNYLEFIRQFRNMGGDLGKLQDESREIIKRHIVKDATLADHYLDLIFTENESSKSWSVLAGYTSTRGMKRREVMFLNSIVEILCRVGLYQLYVFVDEFEDISKLRGASLTNYLTVLTTLINRQRRWALVVSLNQESLNTIKEESAPLYDRLTSYAIALPPLDQKKAEQLIVRYLNLVRDKESNAIAPFSASSIKKMLNVARGNYRSFILLAHKCLEVALERGTSNINDEIVETARDLRIHEASNTTI